jgi:hypothetical protein
MSNVCLSCHRPDRPGELYAGESKYGLPLASFFLCRECVAAGFEADLCAACKEPESAKRPGNAFTLHGASGPGPRPFFLHNDCAPLAGPKQGVTQVYLDEMAKQGKG